MDRASVAQRVSATVLPQVVSLRPREKIRFSTIVLDARGNQIFPLESSWEILDPSAGVISQDGHFRSGEEPGIRPDAIRVSMVLPGLDENVIATGTVITVEELHPEGPKGELLLPRVTVFPERVVLSPGESTRVSIIGLDTRVHGPSTANVSWSVTPPEVGEVSQFITVTAHDFPGTYEGAIRANLTLETPSGPVTQAVSATLVIRGTLDGVEIVPADVTLGHGERMPFRAVAYDENRVLIPDVFFRWSVADPDAGTIDASGVFVARGHPGEYPGAVHVEAVQRRGAARP